MLDLSKVVLLIRGVSGSSKTTFANYLYSILSNDKSGVICSADDYMIDNHGNYKFDAEKLGFCHNSCKTKFKDSLESSVDLIIISNTNTTEKEINPYIELAGEYNYKVFSIVMENRHGGVNQHGVSLEALNKQANRIKGSLKLL